ncbi:MAG: hypothetical protein Q9198_004769, partial [Flavoplaca austrocitrina]
NRAYDIRDCGSFTDQVEVALNLRQEPLDAAINTAKQGVKGPHGFRSWFKDDTAIPKVTEVLKNIRFVVDAEMTRLAYYQTYALIHEMVHFYLQGETLGLNTDPKETYASNFCVNFDTKTSLRNPMNFQFFIA